MEFRRKKIVEKSIEAWEKSGINFEKQEKCISFQILHIRKSDENTQSRATIGWKEKELNHITVDKWHILNFIISHELGHVIGLFHEHQRLDRDNYIKLNQYSDYNINSPDIKIKQHPLYSEESLSFDFHSIMIYYSEFISIIPKEFITKSYFLTELDLQAVKIIYGL